MTTNILGSKAGAPSDHTRVDDNEMQTQLTDRSKKIIRAMDTDGDGVISYEEAAKYGKTQEKNIEKWKCYFIGLFTLLLIIFGVIFGLFILGFELTKQTDVDNDNTIHNTNSLTTSDGNNLISTVRGTATISNISQYWDFDSSSSNINSDEMIVRFIRGYFDDEYIYATISYFIIEYSPIELMTFYDNSGMLKFELYRYINDTNDGNQFVLYQTLNNGTIVKKISNVKIGDNDDSRRRLQVCDCTDLAGTASSCTTDQLAQCFTFGF